MASEAREGTSRAADFVRSKASDVAEDVRGGASRAADGVRSKASEVAGSMRSTASDVAEGMRSGARRAGERIGEAVDGAGFQAHRAADRARHEYSQRPLVGVLAAFGAGALLGALVPSTRRENELIGPYRDGLLEKARDYGEEVLERGERVARAAVESGKSEAQSDTHRDAGEKAAEVLKSAIDEAHTSGRREARDMDNPTSF